jgi:hypothetical protein
MKITGLGHEYYDRLKEYQEQRGTAKKRRRRVPVLIA